MRKCIAAVFAFGLVCVIGCGGETKLVRVSGTITQDGQPYEGALVEFSPDPGNAAVTGGKDVTGSSGNYLIRSGGQTGLAPGKYVVTISKAPPETPTFSPLMTDGEPTPEDDPGQMEAFGLAGGAELKTESGQVDGPSGTFEAEVENQDIVLDFDVKS